MSDNIAVTPGTGKSIAGDEVTDSTLGTVTVQYVKLMDGAIDGTNKAIVVAAGGLGVSLVDRIAGENQTDDVIDTHNLTDDANGAQGTIYGPQSVAGSATINTGNYDCSQYRKVGVFAIGDGTHTFQIRVDVSENVSDYAPLNGMAATTAATKQSFVADICGSNLRVVAINGSTTQDIQVWLTLHK